MDMITSWRTDLLKLLNMKVWMQFPGQEVPKYQSWERVQGEVGFHLPYFLCCFCCKRLDTAEVGLGGLAPGWPFWYYDTRMWSIVNFTAAQNFEFTFPKANHFQRGIRERGSESLSQQMTGNHHPSEITRVRHPRAATGEEQIGFLPVYVSTCWSPKTLWATSL